MATSQEPTGPALVVTAQGQEFVFDFSEGTVSLAELAPIVEMYFGDEDDGLEISQDCISVGDSWEWNRTVAEIRGDRVSASEVSFFLAKLAEWFSEVARSLAIAAHNLTPTELPQRLIAGASVGEVGVRLFDIEATPELLAEHRRHLKWHVGAGVVHWQVRWTSISPALLELAERLGAGPREIAWARWAQGYEPRHRHVLAGLALDAFRRQDEEQLGKIAEAEGILGEAEQILRDGKSHAENTNAPRKAFVPYATRVEGCVRRLGDMFPSLAADFASVLAPPVLAEHASHSETGPDPWRDD